ncbi:MAG: ATP-binding protein [Actinomycetota bacterium]|nr:ATP-binding protein [Actinomycetota bacterium]
MPTQLTILSGKGGTGKTTITASFLHLAGGAVAADCDVDAPNLHLLLDPTPISREPFEGGMIAHIDYDKCTKCGICEESCLFSAISDLVVDPFSCEGCGVCELVCQDDAVRLLPETTGDVFVSETKFGPLAHALLKPGGEASGKLVTRVKEVASRLARERGLDLVIVDGSPGIGCPVIASVAGSDLILAVAEPSLSGLWGLERIHGVARHFEIEMAVCINKSDVNPKIAKEIHRYCLESKLPLLGEVPFDEEVNQATMSGEVLVERYSGPAASALEDFWERTIALLESVKTKR